MPIKADDKINTTLLLSIKRLYEWFIFASGVNTDC